jgi:hypothetical protein
VHGLTFTKQAENCRELISSVFWDKKGVLMVQFMQQTTAVTSECIAKHWKNCVQNKQHGILTCVVVLLHDNAHPHHTWTVLKHFN